MGDFYFLPFSFPKVNLGPFLSLKKAEKRCSQLLSLFWTGWVLEVNLTLNLSAESLVTSHGAARLYRGTAASPSHPTHSPAFPHKVFALHTAMPRWAAFSLNLASRAVPSLLRCETPCCLVQWPSVFSPLWYSLYQCV